MKTFVSLVFILVIVFAQSLEAQSPAAFNYQGVAREGNELITEDLDLRLSLRKDSASGPVVFQETFIGISPKPQGQFSVKWGLNQHGLDTIDWSEGPFFQQVEVGLTSTGILSDLGTTQLLAVPYAMYAEQAGNEYWIEQDTNIFYDKGNIGINVGNPTFPLHLKGNKFRIDGTNDADIELNILSQSSIRPELRFLVDEELKGVLQLRKESKFLLLWEAMSDEATELVLKDGRIGMNTLSPKDALHVRGVIRAEGVNSHQKIRMHTPGPDYDNRITSYDENGDLMWYMNMGRRSNSDRFEIDRPGNGVSDFYITTDGETNVRTLRIHGGADIKEDFNALQQLQPGDVVVIDEENPGMLKLTTEPYDKKVAGVISGANGVQPGLSLSQSDIMEGKYPLSMVGRVFVKVIGPIKVGDRLTTSSQPGYAMAVKDPTQAPGAVIGKAMTANEGGKGMVLVLVNLQ